MVWPTALYETGLALLTKVSVLVCVAVTVALAGAEVAPLPEAVAVLVIEPASRSVCFIVGAFVNLIDALAVRGALPLEVIVPSLSSVTEKGPARVTLLELVIV